MKSKGITLGYGASRFLLLILVSFVLIGIDYFKIISPLRGFAEGILFPLKGGVYAKSVSFGRVATVLFNFSETKQLQDTLNRVKAENDRLATDVRLLTIENESLRKQLEAPLSSSWKFRPATVLGFNRYLQIWGGEDDGIRVGMTVVSGKYYVGKIISSTLHTSNVILPSDPEASIPSVSDRGTKGKVMGSFGEKIYFDKVLQKEQLFIDDQILTTGEEGYAPNLIIGDITSIETKDFEVYKKGELKPSIVYDKESVVFIVTEM